MTFWNFNFGKTSTKSFPINFVSIIDTIYYIYIYISYNIDIILLKFSQIWSIHAAIVAEVDGITWKLLTGDPGCSLFNAPWKGSKTKKNQNSISAVKSKTVAYFVLIVHNYKK